LLNFGPLLGSQIAHASTPFHSPSELFFLLSGYDKCGH